MGDFLLLRRGDVGHDEVEEAQTSELDASTAAADEDGPGRLVLRHAARHVVAHARLPQLLLARLHAEAGAERRLHIGGQVRKEGWEVFNALPGPAVDHLGDAQDLRRFADGSFIEVYASHCLEHFDFREEVARALAEWHRVLAPAALAMGALMGVVAVVPALPHAVEKLLDLGGDCAVPAPGAGG